MDRFCVNHQTRTTDYVCSKCGEHFCKECLDEAILHYYCRKPECREAYSIEISSSLPLQVDCPNCNNLIELSGHERMERIFTCPECSAVIDNAGEALQIKNPRRHYDTNLTDVNKPNIFHLFIFPRKFFSRIVILGKKPYLYIITYLIGITTIMDQIDGKLFTNRTNIDSIYYDISQSWFYYWSFSLLLAVGGALIVWQLGGWWYRKRLQLSGDKDPDKFEVRYVYLYSSFVNTLPYLIVAILYTFLYKNYLLALASDEVLYLIPLAFLFLSIYTSYSGASEVFNIIKRRAMIWFVILPGIFYSLITVLSVFLLITNPQHSDMDISSSIPPEYRIFAIDKSCSVIIPEKGWFIMKSREDDFYLHIVNTLTETSFLIYNGDHKRDILPIVTMEDYIESVLTDLRDQTNLEINSYESIMNLKFNSKKIHMYSSNETGERISGIVAIIETKYYFHMIEYWTLAKLESDNMPIFQKILESFVPVEEQIQSNGDTILRNQKAKSAATSGSAYKY